MERPWQVPMGISDKSIFRLTLYFYGTKQGDLECVSFKPDTLPLFVSEKHPVLVDGLEGWNRDLSSVFILGRVWLPQP